MTKRESVLERSIPTTGRAADAYEVAFTAGILRKCDNRIAASEAARHATLLHVISGKLHRIAERQCNEDLTCRECRGDGQKYNDEGIRGLPAGEYRECKACAGRGNTLGRSESRLEADAREIAEHYGLRVYFQGDPRGCSLYLINPAIIPTNTADLDDYRYRTNDESATLADLQRRWIAANYNRGHAVSRLGR